MNQVARARWSAVAATSSQIRIYELGLYGVESGGVNAVSALSRRFYPSLQDRWDDIAFRECILQFLQPDHKLLDLGCGRGAVPQMNFRGLAHIQGVDPAQDCFRNPFLDEAKIGTAEHIPHQDNSFDLVVCNNVLEHLGDPPTAFREIHRVLARGGRLFVKTPNQWHYVPIASRLTPYKFHRWFYGKMGSEPDDAFPVHYRANSLLRLRKLATAAGFSILQIGTIEGRPEYLRWAAVPYTLGIAYERLVNSTPFLANFRVVIIGVFQKTPVAGDDIASTRATVKQDSEQSNGSPNRTNQALINTNL